MADIFYANDYPVIQLKAPKKLNLLKMADLDFDRLGYLFVANTSLINKSPKLVHRMVRATLKGFHYTINNPDDAIAIMTRLYRKRLGKDLITQQVNNMFDLILQKPALGKATDQMWNQSLDLLGQSGITNKKMSPSKYYTNEFLA